MSEDEIVEMIIQCEKRRIHGPPVVAMSVEQLLHVLYALAAARRIDI